jgi:signal transduction histidine kinase
LRDISHFREKGYEAAYHTPDGDSVCGPSLHLALPVHEREEPECRSPHPCLEELFISKYHWKGGKQMTASGSSSTRYPIDDLSPRGENFLDLLKIFSHDCRNDLVSMGAALALVQKGVYGTLNEGAKNEIHKVFQRAAKMIGTLEDAIAEALALKGELGLRVEAIDLKDDILEPLLKELSHDVPRERTLLIYHPPELSAENGLQIQGNKFLLKSVFRNLMKNAAAYGAEQEKIIVRITRIDRYVIIDVCNHGDPLPEELQRDLFTNSNGSRSCAHRKQQGLGIGLSLVKKIVESHSGRIWYRAEENASHFLFSLPASREPN